jgi:hypothetical protein
MTHGTRSGYNRGCRCPSCTEANTAASRARRERIAGRSASVRITLPAHQLVPDGHILISQRRKVAAPRPRPAVSRADHLQNPQGNGWDKYAQVLRLYLAGVGRSPSLLALQDEVEEYYSLAGDYGP